MSQKPKYQIISEDIISQIEDGRLRANQILPSENKMCELYSTSRITIRKAIDQLVKQGYVFKKSGKGSFVCDNIKTEGLTKVHSFTEAILHQGKKPSKHVLRKQLIYPSKELQLAFNLNDYENIYEILTIYYADEVPFCFNTSYLPQCNTPHYRRNQHQIISTKQLLISSHYTHEIMLLPQFHHFIPIKNYHLPYIVSDSFSYFSKLAISFIPFAIVILSTTESCLLIRS